MIEQVIATRIQMWKTFMCWYVWGHSAADRLTWIVVRARSKKDAIRRYDTKLKRRGEKVIEEERAIWASTANWKVVGRSGVYKKSIDYESDDDTWMNRRFRSLL